METPDLGLHVLIVAADDAFCDLYGDLVVADSSIVNSAAYLFDYIAGLEIISGEVD